MLVCDGRKYKGEIVRISQIRRSSKERTRRAEKKEKKKNNARRERAQIRSGTRSGAVVSSGIDRIDSMIFASRRVAVHMSDNRVR